METVRRFVLVLKCNKLSITCVEIASYFLYVAQEKAEFANLYRKITSFKFAVKIKISEMHLRNE